MSTRSYGKAEDPPIAASSSKRTLNSNTGAFRSPDPLSPNKATNFPGGSILASQDQHHASSNQNEIHPQPQEGLLRQRRSILGKTRNAGENDERGNAGETTTATSSRMYSTTSPAPKTESVSSSFDMRPSTSGTSTEYLAGRVRLLSTLTTRADKLREEQEAHLLRAQGLEEQIKAGELASGRMTQQVLDFQETIRRLTQQVIQTQEAIITRKRHIKEDREKLSQELRSRERKTEEIMSIVSRVNTIAQETKTEIAVGERAHLDMSP